jgi:hypothetical protein
MHGEEWLHNRCVRCLRVTEEHCRQVTSQAQQSGTRAARGCMEACGTTESRRSEQRHSPGGRHSRGRGRDGCRRLRPHGPPVVGLPLEARQVHREVGLQGSNRLGGQTALVVVVLHVRLVEQLVQHESGVRAALPDPAVAPCRGVDRPRRRSGGSAPSFIATKGRPRPLAWEPAVPPAFSTHELVAPVPKDPVVATEPRPAACSPAAAATRRNALSASRRA